MTDAEHRELERLVLGGDAVALERLKTAWLRDHDTTPAVEALLGRAPDREMLADLTAQFAAIQAFDGKPARWELTNKSVSLRFLDNERAFETQRYLDSQRIYRHGDTSGARGESPPSPRPGLHVPSPCPICERQSCDHTPDERGQTFSEMMGDDE